MNRLTRVALAMGSFTAVNIVVGFIRSKFSAIVMGPVGIGYFSQASGFFNLMSVICTLTMGVGITKRVSEALDAGNRESVGELLDTCLRVLCITGGVAALGVCVLATPIARTLFGDVRLISSVFWLAVGIPFSAIAVGLIADPVLLGVDRVDLYTRGSLVATVFGLIPFLICTKIWGVTGAIVSLGLAAVLRFATFVYYVRKAVDWRPRWRFSMPALRSITGYIGMMLVVNAMIEITNLMIRTTILQRLGAAANGIYQVPVALSSYYTVFFANALWGHSLVKMSRDLDIQERRRELEAAARFIILGFCAAAVLLIAIRGPLIIMLYSRRFLAAAGLMPWFVLADFLFLAATVYHVSLLSLPRLKANLAIWVGHCLLRAALSLVLLKHMGIVGPAVAYAVSAGAMLVAFLVYHSVRLHLPISGANLRRLLTAAVLISAPLFLPGPMSFRMTLQIVLTLGWLPLAMSPEERQAVVHGVMSRLGRERAACGPKETPAP